MADPKNQQEDRIPPLVPEETTNPVGPVNEVVAPPVNDPGRAHEKGYSADPLSPPPVRDPTYPVKGVTEGQDNQ